MIVFFSFHLLWGFSFGNFAWHPPYTFNHEQTTMQNMKNHLKMRAMSMKYNHKPMQYTRKLQFLNKVVTDVQILLNSCLYFIQDEDYLLTNASLFQEQLLNCVIKHLVL